MRADRRLIARSVAWLATLVSLLAAPAAQAGPNGGVGYRVDGEPGSTIDGGFITLKVGAGGTATGHFYATNSGDRDAQLTVYPADGLTGDTTGIVYSGLGEARNDAGAWLSPSTRGILLRADDSRRVDFSLHVPSGTTPGDHVGGIVLEQRRTGGTISQVVRNVVPVLVDVNGPAGFSLDLRSAMVSDLPGTSLPAVTVKMRNDGRRICRPTLAVALTGPGERGAQVVRALDALLPGDNVPFPLPWPRALGSGNYTAVVTATGCGPTRTMRTDVRNDVTAETNTPRQSSDNELITSAPPTQPQYTAPRGGKNSARGQGGDDQDAKGTDASGTGIVGGGGPPAGETGSGTASGKSGGGASALPQFPGLSKLGDVAIKYLPPLLERLIAPLSLLGLMLLFLFAQEAFDRKDPKLALAPVQRDPDLEFLPLDDLDLGAPGPAPSSDLEVLPAPSPPPRPTTS
jgi:hypothetical protein